MIKFLDLGNGICVNVNTIACVQRTETPLHSFVLTIHLVNGQKIEATGGEAGEINNLLQEIGLPVCSINIEPQRAASVVQDKGVTGVLPPLVGSRS